MALKSKYRNTNIFFLLSFAFILIQGCASMQQPQGGPKDEEGPKILSEIPANLSRNFNSKKITLEFDEYFKLTNEYSEISISPNQEISPVYRIKQKKLEIELKDTLEANTTYTINFGKAVTDVNEGNKLKEYTYVFATGKEIDSLKIEGKVVNSLDNKPVLDATVFILPINRDTLFGKKRAPIYTSTDSSGNFSLKNLKENKYRLYALKEETTGDKIYNDPKEKIAFLIEDVNLTKDTSNITLKLFNEEIEKYRNIDRKIEKDGKITIIYNRPIEKPLFKILNKEPNSYIVNSSKNGDTTSIWVKDMTFDSLKVVTANADKIIDTLNIKRAKKDTYTANVAYQTNLLNGKIKPGNQLELIFNSPIQNLDRSKLVIYQDTIPFTGYRIDNIDKINRIYRITYPWKVKKLYTIQFKEDAITDYFGEKNKDLKTVFELDEIENYGNLAFNFVRQDTSQHYVIQLLDEKSNILSENALETDKMIEYKMMPNGKYLLRIVADENKNGKFDTGNVKAKKQPEKMWLFDKEIIIRPNWDREEKITIPKDFI